MRFERRARMSSAALLGCVTFAVAAGKPNIIFFLTDDQDQVLGASFPTTAPGGATPLPKTHSLMVEGGSTATKFYIHTPICCPSRAETLTGRYLHNVHTPLASKQCTDEYEGTDASGGDCCMHVDEPMVNNFTMATYLQTAGYTSGMFGKYLNVCPSTAQPGWDAWFANGGGNYMNTSFAIQNINGIPDGMKKFQGGQGEPFPYSTSLIGNFSHAWIKEVANGPKPFLAYIGFKAAHDPFIPAPWYADYWDPSWPSGAPRPPSFNCSMQSRVNHHPTVASQAMLTDDVVACIDEAFMNRWRTLMSVDDAIADTFALAEELGIMSNTYFFYSSDHGFQLGELNMPQDKRNVYEFDTRIHFVARGPGIIPGSTWSAPATNVDIKPTFLELAGVDSPATVDGRSFLSFILTNNSQGSAYATSPNSWRESVFIHHYRVGAGSYCGVGHHIDQDDNNFIAVRHFGGDVGNVLYAEFQWANSTDFGEGNCDFNSIYMVEMYDMDKDPWQLNNIYTSTKATNPDLIDRLHKETHQWFQCKGTTGADACV